MKPVLLSPTPLAVACLSVLLPACALAQSGQVVVTGSPRALLALDAPFAITSVDASALRDAGPMINLSEAMARVPGLVVNNRNNYSQDLQISSRGFGARAGFGVRGLRLYADGIPASMPDGQGQVAHFDLAGAQRIEVLRGPFSVLYGNSSGGVIALFTAPVRQPQAEVALDAGSFGLLQQRIGVAGRVGSEVDLRASYTNLETDGFRPQSASHRRLANVRLGWQRGADTVTLLLSNHDQTAQDPLGLTPALFRADPRQTVALALGGYDPARPALLRYDTRKTSRQSQAGVSWQHDFGDLGVLREGRLTAYHGSRGVTQWQAIPPATQVNPAVPVAVKQGGGVVDFDRGYGGVEGRLTLRLGATDLVAGLNVETLEDERRGYENFTGPPAAPTALGITGKQRRDETNRATTTEGFVQARTPLGAAWDLTGGVRGGQVEMSTHDRYVNGLNVDDSGALSFSYVNPALGLRWAPAPGWALHASAARGFESPTLGELAYRPDAAGGFNANLRGQTSRQLELGAKWRSAAVELDVALFKADTANEIGVQTNSGGRSAYQNVGHTRRHGAELSGLWRATPGLRLQAAATWLAATYRDGFLTCTASPCAAANVPVAAGNRISGTQRASAWAEAAWRPGVLPGEVALEWRAVASTVANDINTVQAPGHALAHLRWSGSLPLGPHDAIEALLRVDNLFDRAYVGSVIVNDGNQRYYEPGSPRSTLVSLRWRHQW